MDDRPATVTVPTELERADAFWDFAVLAASALGVIWLLEHGVPWPALVPALIPLALWTLTGEGSADIPYIGNIAGGLRSKFGLRRAHEWVLAYGHYFKVRMWPDWKDRCEASLRSARRRTIEWRARLSEQTRWKRSVACLWGFRIRSR